MHIIVHVQDTTIHIKSAAGQSLSQAIWLSGKLPPPPLCSGLGRCGKCKVLFISPPPTVKDIEQSILSARDIARGVRLACRHNVDELDISNDNNIEISLIHIPAAEQEIDIISPAPSALLAVDLGTTSIHWQAISPQGQCIASGEQINPQMGAGSDIVSRLAFALKDTATLANLVSTELQNIIRKLPEITEMCIAGNTAMSGILLQKDIKSLAMAPYALPLTGHSVEHITALPPIYIPPQLAPFVGGDISAGYAALMQRDDIEFPFIFTDLGTNAEFILAQKGTQNAQHAHITSVPLGPALEGIGLTFGHMAHGASGIVNSVRLSPSGLEPHTLDGKSPSHICGTGYLSIIHCLLRAGLVQEDGRFCQEKSITNPLCAKLYKWIERQNDEYIFRLWPHVADAEHMYISSTDIEEILKVKAAFSLAMQELLTATATTHTSLKAIYMAGAMGSHAEGDDLEALGFVPYGLSKRIIRVGNTALNGAKLLLLEPKKRNWLQEWSKHNTHVQLAEQSDFIQKYMKNMRFAFIG